MSVRVSVTGKRIARGLTVSRNLITDEIAANSRGVGGLTFNAPIPFDYEGPAMTWAAVRIGDHAHITVESGNAVPRRAELLREGNGFRERPYYVMGRAGQMILRWHEWQMLRVVLDASLMMHITDVEKPNSGQLARYTVETK